MLILAGKHYKHVASGGICRVVAVARVKATKAAVVVYLGVNTESWEPHSDPPWTCPLEEFRDGFEAIFSRGFQI